MISLRDDEGTDCPKRTANDNAAPNEATPRDPPVSFGAAAKRRSHRDVACVVNGLDALFPVQHEEVLIAGPLIEAVIEKLKTCAANENEELP